MKKKLPPFGKQLKERMRKGYQPNNGVNIYTSWNMGHNYHHGYLYALNIRGVLPASMRADVSPLVL